MQEHAPIETGIDKLHQLVLLRDQLSFTDAARLLKVPRSMVAAWAETLEDANLIVTENSLRETYLLNPKFSDCTKFGKVLKRNFLSLTTPFITAEEHSLRKKEHTIALQLTELKKKTRELKQLHDRSADLHALEKQLNERQKLLEQQEKQLQKKEKVLERKYSRNEQLAQHSKDASARSLYRLAQIKQYEMTIKDYLQQCTKKERELRLILHQLRTFEKQNT